MLSALLLLALLLLPFLGKPVHIDDANFLALAAGARLDPWRPHAVVINWQGTAEPAFAVLSNPPGIAWWLAPVLPLPLPLQHLWMILPWLPLAAWGAARLARAFSAPPFLAILLLCASPAALLAAQSFTPDLPLLACSLAGLGGLLTVRPGRPRWPFALLVGCAALFRYSGAALIPLAAAAPLLLRGDARSALRCLLAAAAPLALLCLHDLHAYGALHVATMVGFQSVNDSGPALLHKLAAAVTMLGGALVLPLLGPPPRLLLGALLGGLPALLLLPTPDPGTLLFCAAGGATLAGATAAPAERTRLWGLLWLLGGLVFLLKLRFTAARYWLPFFAPAALLPLRDAPPGRARLAAALTVLLALALSVDDLELARAQRTLARAVVTATTDDTTPRLFAGHWGWQHHLEAAGWTALDEDTTPPLGAWLATSARAWPQEPASSTCLTERGRWTAPDAWPGPRVHTLAGRANLHASVISASPPVESYAPWGWGSDPQDEAVLWRVCGSVSGDGAGGP